MTKTKTLDEILAEHMPIDKNHAEDAKNIKAAILEAVKEIIGEDEPRGKYNAESLLERDVIIGNIIRAEQRARADKFIGGKNDE